MSSSTTSPPKLSTTERVNKSKSCYLLIFLQLLRIIIHNYFPIWNLIFHVKTPDSGGKIWNLGSWIENFLSMSFFDMTIVINVKMFWKFDGRKIWENLGASFLSIFWCIVAEIWHLLRCQVFLGTYFTLILVV